jgi:hypothetical protein
MKNTDKIKRKKRMPNGIYSEIAERLGISTATVKMRYYRKDLDVINKIAQIQVQRKNKLKQALDKLQKADEFDPTAKFFKY